MFFSTPGLVWVSLYVCMYVCMYGRLQNFDVAVVIRCTCQIKKPHKLGYMYLYTICTLFVYFLHYLLHYLYTICILFVHCCIPHEYSCTLSADSTSHPVVERVAQVARLVTEILKQDWSLAPHLRPITSQYFAIIQK